MPPGLMSRRKSRHMVWEMGTGDWGIGNGKWRMGQQESTSTDRESIKPIIPIAPPESL